MKRNSKMMIWLVTLSFVIAMVMVVMGATKEVKRQTEESCYAKLEEATQSLAQAFYQSAQMDRMILNAMASVIASEEEPTDSMLCTMLNSYGSIDSYISYMEILRPDNVTLDQEGRLRDVSGFLDFAQEAERGSYISRAIPSQRDPNELLIRNAVPVVVDGETVYMLYGVIRLSELEKDYTTDIYDGHAYVYLVDGTTGNMLLDTWHHNRENITAFNDRECLSEDDFVDASYKMRQGLSGSLSFRSKSTGDILYMHYEPIGLNDWTVCVTIQDRYAFTSSIRIQRTMEQLALVMSLIVLCYLAFVVLVMTRAYRRIQDVGLNDRNTGLKNRNAYDAFLDQHQHARLPQAACVYVDANGLHELNNREGHAAGDLMLSRIAAELKKEFPAPTIYRVGGDEFVMLTTELAESTCREKAHRVQARLEEMGYSIAYGVACQKDATGFEGVIHLADEQMLTDKKGHYSRQKRGIR